MVALVGVSRGGELLADNRLRRPLSSNPPGCSSIALSTYKGVWNEQYE